MSIKEVKMKPIPVEVDWVDSYALTGWCTEKDVESTHADNCLSVGYMVRKDRKEVVLASGQSVDSENRQHLIAIPRCCVKSIRKLVQENKEEAPRWNFGKE